EPTSKEEPTGEGIASRSARVGLRRPLLLGLLCLLALERTVDLEQRLLLSLGDAAVSEDVGDEIRLRVALFEDPGADVERLRRDPQRACDRLEDLGARLPQTAFDLAQVGIGDPGQLAELPQRQPCRAPLIADELTEVVQPRVEVGCHSRAAI